MRLVTTPKVEHRAPPDDFAEDELFEMANLDEGETNVPGTIFISTALGAHGPRVKWFPAKAGRALPCLIVSIEADPVVRDDVLPSRISRSGASKVIAWVRLNHVALLDFWTNGDSWNTRDVAAFLGGLQRLP